MEPISKNLDLLKLEERILEFWENEDIYSMIKTKENPDKIWRFIDGPPYTTGSIHLGTAWNKILKDYLIRYKRMQGFKVTDTPGYDTHGLPIEVQMEKELNIKNKQEILEYGVDKFITNCKEFAQRNLKIMNDQFKRLGSYFWNWENPYITFKNSYIEGIWWTLKRAWENDLLYQFYRPLNCCPRCATALAKHEHEYLNVKDTSIFVKFESAEDEKTFFIIWTTTPWTLVANSAIMVNPIAEYAKVYIKDLDEYWILSKNSITFFISGQLGYKYKIDRDYIGEDLEGMKYIHPLLDEVPYQKELAKKSEKMHSILLSEEYVSAGEGVGLVHTAPGHGPEDFDVGVKNGLPIFNPVKIDGLYNEKAGKFKNQFVFDANKEIIEILKEKGTLIDTDIVEHEYAHCWRCKSKLVYRATKQWFFKTESISEELLGQNEKIYWVPEWAGMKWFKSWLSSIKDWCISRQRFWGIPLSVWICNDKKCGDITVIGSAKELKKIAGECPEDLHRPWIDKITWKCEKCKKGTKTRIPDILDVWLDSGSVVWAAQEVYDGESHYDTWIPADFILEGKDQIRGWFNSLLCSAMVSSKRKNYDACYMHGWVMREGEKMSKSLGNFIEPEDLINGTLKDLQKKKSYSKIKGIETFRFYCIGATQPGRDLNFSAKEYADTYRVINTIWNLFVYANEKCRLANFNPSKHKYDIKKMDKTDKWLLSRLNTTIKKITNLSDTYILPSITETLRDFIVNDLSRWYVVLIRDKIEVYSDDSEKYPVLSLLYDVLFKVLLLLSPINPMLTEEIYHKMFKLNMKSMNLNETLSIHLQDWPKVEEKLIDEDIENQMIFIQELIEEARALKDEYRIRLRWPNKKIVIVTEEKVPEEEFQIIFKKTVNVKELEITKSFKSNEDYVKTDSKYGIIYLDKTVDEDILTERIISDLIRNIQFSRKINKFQAGENISLKIGANAPYLIKFIENSKDYISDKVSANEVIINNSNIKNDKIKIYEELKLCGNKDCSASLKDNILKKLDKESNIKCPHCNSELKINNIRTISFTYNKN
ncbi:MAG: isoleucine--tRNA ligase [Candidatus Lokiarchaeota archaeon]|nr:isoleucine--tRNA ligase [Candidatus Lokiarchaeota archaeon]